MLVLDTLKQKRMASHVLPPKSWEGKKKQNPTDRTDSYVGLGLHILLLEGVCIVWGCKKSFSLF